jgi:hypothetical protein
MTESRQARTKSDLQRGVRQSEVAVAEILGAESNSPVAIWTWRSVKLRRSSFATFLCCLQI